MKTGKPKVGALLKLLREKDSIAHTHSLRVAQISLGIAHAMGIEDSRGLRILRLGGLLHDIGKAAVPLDIRLKHGRCLSEKEMQVIRRHPGHGHSIVCSSLGDLRIAQIVLDHHENFDGSGYPCGLSGSEIGLLSKICSVADSFDVVFNGRGYRKRKPLLESILEIEKYSGKRYDPDVVRAFVKYALNLGCLNGKSRH
ncbi:MAG: HD domain-containing protein [Victivallales bacterium]|nr:HD domain-containing protein [Victivallales bacterium]